MLTRGKIVLKTLHHGLNRGLNRCWQKLANPGSTSLVAIISSSRLSILASD